jgi:regulator of replication initiation timing
MPITIGTGKSKSEPLFELSLNRQHTLSFDILTLSCREEDEKVLNDINEHIETMKTEIQKITEELVRVSRENETLFDNNEKLAKNYLRNHDYIDISQTTERKAITKSKYSKSNSNIADEVFKFVDANYLSPRIP